MTAALALSHQGYPVSLIEQTDVLGGHGRSLHRTHKGDDIPSYIEHLANDVTENKGIDVYLNTTIKGVAGFVGNFETEIDSNGKTEKIKHGVASSQPAPESSSQPNTITVIIPRW